MQLSDCNRHITMDSLAAERESTERTCLRPPVVSDRLLAILACGSLAALGPVILDAIEQASVLSLQILLEICRFGLVALQIFGR
jgi:hypothetical protein